MRLDLATALDPAWEQACARLVAGLDWGNRAPANTAEHAGALEAWFKAQGLPAQRVEGTVSHRLVRANPGQRDPKATSTSFPTLHGVETNGRLVFPSGAGSWDQALAEAHDGASLYQKMVAEDPRRALHSTCSVGAPGPAPLASFAPPPDLALLDAWLAAAPLADPVGVAFRAAADRLGTEPLRDLALETLRALGPRDGAFDLRLQEAQVLREPGQPRWRQHTAFVFVHRQADRENQTVAVGGVGARRSWSYQTGFGGVESPPKSSLRGEWPSLTGKAATPGSPVHEGGRLVAAALRAAFLERALPATASGGAATARRPRL